MLLKTVGHRVVVVFEQTHLCLQF